MNTRRSLIDDTARLLQQGITLLDGLSDDLYSRPEPSVASSGIGSHFRHLIDYYDRFLAGLAEGRLDYDQRARDEALETQTGRAQARLRDVCSALGQLVEDELPQSLTVKMDSHESDRDAPRSRSSVERELQFLMSHTVHHFALIAVILRLNDLGVDEGFGVAPSTLRYWKESRSCAP